MLKGVKQKIDLNLCVRVNPNPPKPLQNEDRLC
jgi:hypothetical protein